MNFDAINALANDYLRLECRGSNSSETQNELFSAVNKAIEEIAGGNLIDSEEKIRKRIHKFISKNKRNNTVDLAPFILEYPTRRVVGDSSSKVRPSEDLAARLSRVNIEEASTGRHTSDTHLTELLSGFSIGGAAAASTSRRGASRPTQGNNRDAEALRRRLERSSRNKNQRKGGITKPRQRK